MMKRAEVACGIPRRRTWFILPVLLLSLGCGGPKGDISGKVIYLGKPLPGGTITFFSAENQMVGSSSINAEGDYSMAKVPAGPVKITVTAPFSIRNPAAPPPTKGGNKKTERGKMRPDLKEVKEEKRALIRLNFPTKYSMPDQSDLTYTVQPGHQEYSLDLK